MSPDPVNWTALDRSTYATASLAGDPFYVEPPSVQPGLTIGEYRRRREASRKASTPPASDRRRDAAHRSLDWPAAPLVEGAIPLP